MGRGLGSLARTKELRMTHTPWRGGHLAYEGVGILVGDFELNP